ncbi:MAG: L,D-transpeptidase [Pseudomonadota bacterium]|nr:L,D-transpeptidase [Pseudomonadota bacterium]
MLYISINEQKLYILDSVGNINYSTQISTAYNGTGQQSGSYKTPLGLHFISELYGHNEPINTVFVARRKTGEIFNNDLLKSFPNRDWILTRIIRLSGLEPDFNLGGDVDTYSRYIYIHGCPDSTDFSNPGSHGCVRVKNADLINLFDMVAVGDIVFLENEVYNRNIFDSLLARKKNNCNYSESL